MSMRYRGSDIDAEQVRYVGELREARGDGHNNQYRHDVPRKEKEHLASAKLGGDIPPPEKWREKPDPVEFVAELENSKRAAYLEPCTPEGLKGYDLIQSEDGKVGASVSPNGCLQNVFSNREGRQGAGRRAILEAIHRGATSLNCYDGFLPGMYTQFGFVEKGWTKWDDKEAPSNWDEADGKRDIIFMRLEKNVGNDNAILARLSDKAQWLPRQRSNKEYASYDEGYADTGRAGYH